MHHKTADSTHSSRSAERARSTKTTRTTRRTRSAGRRHPLATVALIGIGLLSTGGAYALVTTSASAETSASQDATIDQGGKLFAANCATCHGMALQGSTQGPSLIGVGAAAVDFQVGTGRMPLAATGPQAEQKPVQFTDADVAALAAYVASKGPGPAIPDSSLLGATGDAAVGAELFRVNCAMCHNVAGAGGALTEGKYAPALSGVDPKYIYEAMVTGPQNMPVFNDTNISPQDKANIITYLKYLDKTPSVGGLDLGGIGPVSEGLFIWIFGLGAVVAITVWLTAKSN
jgi:ubiquinol-cytochrome c reductase cytochrome c subunit